MLPQEVFKFRVSEMPFPAISKTRQDKTLFIVKKYIILRSGTANSVANLGWPGDTKKKTALS